MSSHTLTPGIRLGATIDEAYWKLVCWFGRQFRDMWADGMYYVRRSNAWPKQLEEDA